MITGPQSLKLIYDGEHSDRWQPLSYSVIRVSEAIVAYARIYTCISSWNTTLTLALLCLVSRQQKLVSSSVLSKFKLEQPCNRRIHFSSETCYIHRKDDKVIKYEGPGENLVTPKWFDLKLSSPSHTGISSPLIIKNMRLMPFSHGVMAKGCMRVAAFLQSSCTCILNCLVT